MKTDVEMSPTGLQLELKRDSLNGDVEEIVRQYFAMVYSTCLRITRDRHEAEDASQAVFLCLAMQMRDKKDIHAVGPWLYQVACRASIDLCRRRNRRANHEFAFAGQNSLIATDGSNAAGNVDLQEIRPLVLQALNELPTKYRLPLILHYFGGLSHAELAGELGCTRTTLRVRMHRGHKMLREIMRRQGLHLAGGALGMTLASTVQLHVSEAIIGNAASLGTRAARLGINACSVTPDVLATACAMAAPRLARFKFALILGLIGSAFCAASVSVYAKLKNEWLELPSIPAIETPAIKPVFTAPMPKLLSENTGGGPEEVQSAAAPVATTPQSPQVAAAQRPTPIHMRSPITAPVTPYPKPAAPRYAIEGRSVRPMVAEWPSEFPRLEPATGARAMTNADPAAPVPWSRSLTPAAYPAKTRQIASAANREKKRLDTEDRLATAQQPPRGGATEFAAAAADFGGRGAEFAGRAPMPRSLRRIPPEPDPIRRIVPEADPPRLALSGRVNVYSADDDGGIAAGLSAVVDASDSALWLRSVKRAAAYTAGAESYVSVFSYDSIRSTVQVRGASIETATVSVSEYLAIPKLPISIQPGRHDYYWGYDPAEDVDVINSVKLDITASNSTSIGIHLLSPTNYTIPTLPTGHHFAGIWKVDGYLAPITDLEVTVRYDDAFLAMRQLNEANVKLWYFSPTTGWTLTWDQFWRDTDLNLVHARMPASGYFAVSTPEPGTATLILLAGGFTLLRRNRRD